MVSYCFGNGLSAGLRLYCLASNPRADDWRKSSKGMGRERLSPSLALRRYVYGINQRAIVSARQPRLYCVRRGIDLGGNQQPVRRPGDVAGGVSSARIGRWSERRWGGRKFCDRHKMTKTFPYYLINVKSHQWSTR